MTNGFRLMKPERMMDRKAEMEAREADMQAWANFLSAPQKGNSQLDRIEAKLDRLLSLLDKPKREVKRSVSDYSPEFDEIWQLYPKRTGSNPKRSAYIAFQARIKAGETISVLRDGVVAYRAFCDAKGDTGSEYVMQAVRFFGPNKEYLQDWIVPAQKARKPNSEAEWLELGKKFGLDPRVGEPWRDFMDRVWSRV